MTNFEQSYATRRQPRLYPRLTVLALGLFVVATNAFVIAGLLPAIASTLGVQAGDVSYSITWYAIVVAVAAPAISILLPRLSRTVLMSAGMALVAAGTLVAAIAPALPVFTLGRVVAALGGAALVPVATAAAASLAAPAHRGRAIAFVAVGFTAASAFGAPLGTALAAVGGWRAPLICLAGLALIVAVALALGVRGVPVAEALSVRRRFATLLDPRIASTLVATLLLVCGFNVVYIFSSTITAGSTGGSGSLLAGLLLVFGVAGVAGNLVAGRLTDRFGNRSTATVILLLQVLSLAALPLVAGSLIGTALLFAVWGATANAAALPLQDRLVEIDPSNAGVALSWYSTAMYAGIALAPLVGATAFGAGGAPLVPEAGAVAVVLALVAFLIGRARWRSRGAAALPAGA